MNRKKHPSQSILKSYVNSAPYHLIFITFIMGILYFQAWAKDPAPATKVGISITGFHSLKGNVLINLFTAPEGFPDKTNLAFQNIILSVTNNIMTNMFTNVPYGPCAVAAVHDENGNMKMDKTFLGKPKEGYGVSLNAPPSRMGPPSFDNAVFTLTSEGTNISIVLIYPE